MFRQKEVAELLQMLLELGLLNDLQVGQLLACSTTTIQDEVDVTNIITVPLLHDFAIAVHASRALAPCRLLGIDLGEGTMHAMAHQMPGVTAEYGGNWTRRNDPIDGWIRGPLAEVLAKVRGIRPR